MGGTFLDDRRRGYALKLAAAFVLVCLASGWNPRYPADWWLENAVVFAALPLLVSLWRRAPLSRASWTAVFVFLCLHELGAHYTYSEVPYDEWFLAVTGRTLSEMVGWQRNHYDRLVHLLYGGLVTVPLRELFVRSAKVSGAWTYVMPVALTMSSSVIYEMIEWVAAELFGGDLGMAYLGTQGDVWDGHKDMALASVGAVMAMVGAAVRDRWNRH